MSITDAEMMELGRMRARSRMIRELIKDARERGFDRAQRRRFINIVLHAYRLPLLPGASPRPVPPAG